MFSNYVLLSYLFYNFYQTLYMGKHYVKHCRHKQAKISEYMNCTFNWRKNNTLENYTHIYTYTRPL